MRRKITKTSVDALKTNSGPSYLWDTDVSGFGIVATPPSSRHKKGQKAFVFQYRSPEKRDPKGQPKLRKMRLGIHGQGTTVEQARRKAERCRGMLADRRDPQEERDRDDADRKGDITVSKLCDRYLVEAPTIVLPGKGRPKKKSTLAIDRSNIDRHIKPLIGDLRIRQVTQSDIVQMQADIAGGKTADDVKTKKQGRAIVKGGPAIAGRCVALSGGIFGYAVRKQWLDESPVTGVEIMRPEERSNYLKGDELGRLGEALRNMEAEKFNSKAIAAVRLLIFTGARRGEIIGLKWNDVDFELGVINLPDSKTGKKSIPLGAPALEVLQSLPRTSEFVLPGDDPKKAYQGLQKAWEKIRVRAKLEKLRLHDLRHSFATISTAGGSSLFLVGKVLGHAQTRTTEKYTHTDLDPVKAVAERTSRSIQSAMDPKKGKETKAANDG